MDRWNAVFKIFGNINKMKIVYILQNSLGKSVSEITEELDISFKATSKYLNDLSRVGVLVSKGKNNRVYYSLNPKMPADFTKAVRLFSKQ